MRTRTQCRAALGLMLLFVCGCGGGSVSIDRSDDPAGQSDRSAPGPELSATETGGQTEAPAPPVPPTGRTPPPTAAGGTTPASGNGGTSETGTSGGADSAGRKTPRTATKEQPAFPLFVPKPSPKQVVTEVTLLSGTRVDIPALLKKEKADFEKHLEELLDGPRMIRIDYSGGYNDETAFGEPFPASPAVDADGGELSTAGDSRSALQSLRQRGLFLCIGHYAGRTRGPMAAFYKDGRPMIYASYDRDSRRDGPLIVWDEYGRSTLLAQYRQGKLHGLRVLFQPDSARSPISSLRLVEEWRSGKRRASHVVVEGETVTIDAEAPAESSSADALAAAAETVAELESTLRSNERELGKAIAAFTRTEAVLSKALNMGAGEMARIQADRARAQIIAELRAGFQFPVTIDRPAD